MRKSMISATALLILLSSALTNCGNSTVPDDESKSTIPTSEKVTETAETKELTEADIRAQISDNLPETDMNEYAFRIWVREREDFVRDVGLDLEGVGDVVDDAIISRNHTVEERFNCRLAYRTLPAGNMTAEMTKTVMADEDAFDLGLGQVILISPECTNGYYLDWYEDLPYVNLDQPWYIGNAAEACSVGGHAYLMIGEYDLDVLRFTYCMYWNKDIAVNNDLENIYDVVKSGRWTYDYLYDLATVIYSDMDGNSKKDENDLLCVSNDPYSAIVNYTYAFDNPIFTMGADGIPEMTLNTEKGNDIVAKLNTLYWDTPGGYTNTWDTGLEAWKGGRLLVYGNFFMGASTFRDLTFDFGIIPYPKYDEAQTDYYTMSDGAHSAMCVPITVPNPENTSILIEALNAETYKQVVPAYYDTAMKVKYARDRESGEILDILMNGRVFDFGYIYNTGLYQIIQQCVSRKSNDSESMYAQNMTGAIKQYNTFIEAYQALEK